jgi:predicted 3-demethylubiquinone-9 3-methyltransferase (glyoxalase superfamily)
VVHAQPKEEHMSVTPCLWFDGQAEEAAELYTSLVPDSRIVHVARYGEAGPGAPGSTMLVTFELGGRRFTALNGGPEFKFTPAISLEIECADQAEVDRYWSRLTDGGEESQCGWLTDRFGLSWQIVPLRLKELLSDEAVAQQVIRAMLTMKKLDIAALEAAASEGAAV